MFEELDSDLREITRCSLKPITVEVALLLQIVRLLKDKDVEEKSPAVKGFGV